MSTPKSGITVTITKDGVSTSAVTDANGKAVFPNLPVGEYSANIEMPNGYSFAVDDPENNISDTNSNNNYSNALPFIGIDVANAATSNAKIIIKSQHLELRLKCISRPSMSSGVFRVDTLGQVPVALMTGVMIMFGSGNNGTPMSDGDLNYISQAFIFAIPQGDYKSNTFTINFGTGRDYGFAKLFSIDNPNMSVRSNEDALGMIDLSHVLVTDGWKCIISSLQS